MSVPCYAVGEATQFCCFCLKLNSRNRPLLCRLHRFTMLVLKPDKLELFLPYLLHDSQLVTTTHLALYPSVFTCRSSIFSLKTVALLPSLSMALFKLVCRPWLTSKSAFWDPEVRATSIQSRLTNFRCTLHFLAKVFIDIQWFLSGPYG